MGECPSHLKMSRFKSDDLKPAETNRVRAHLEVCDACRRLAAGMDANVSEFAAKAEAQLMSLMNKVEVSTPAPPRRLGFKTAAVASLFAAAAAALLVLTLGTFKSADNREEDRIAFKGALSLEIVAARGGEQFLIKDGSRLAEGDAVRFTVTVDRPGYLTIFSEDAAGKISAFYPDSEPSENPKPLALDSPGRHTLPGSIVLDDTTGTERFVVVFSDRPFDRAAVQKKGAGLSMSGENTAVGKGFSVQSITVTKEIEPGQ